MVHHSKEWEMLDDGYQFIFNNTDEWDFAILDSASLDNTGHIYCSNCQINDEDIKKTEQFIKSFIDNLTNNITLVILSDHGRDDNRDHGGDTLGELYTMFSMHQKDLNFKVNPMDQSVLSSQEKLEVIPHISIASTMSNLLQTFIPFSNIGAFRPEYLVYDDTQSEYDIHKDILKTVLLNGLQIIKSIKFKIIEI